MPARRSTKRKKRKRQLRSPGFTGWAIIFLSIFILVFVLSMTFSTSEVSVSQTAPRIIRLQILNGCGVDGLAEKMDKAFRESGTEALFDIIDKGNAQVFNFEKTLVIDRKGDEAKSGSFSWPASLVAEMLKAGPDQLILQKFSENLLDIDVTVIVGADYQDILKTLMSEVE